MTALKDTGKLTMGDGAQLSWWRSGAGEPVVLVHGSFDDHNTWSPVLYQLVGETDVITYDRRGHSDSVAPSGQGTIKADAADLLSIVDEVAGGSAHIVGHSYGGIVAMLAAVERREAVRSLAVIEPPLYSILRRNPMAQVLVAEASVWMEHAAGLIRSGLSESGARIFAEKVGFGKGAWHGLFSAEQRAAMAANAGTWLDQYTDQDLGEVDITTLAWARFPVTLFVGDQTLPLNTMVAAELADRLPFLRTVRLPDSGHAPHLTHPQEFVAALFGHFRAAAG
jgi:esterase